jgi:RNA methyltransferase, TrmH family
LAPIEIITSQQNPRLKLIRALLTQSKARRREGRVVLEGERLIRDVSEQGYIADFVLYREGLQSALIDQLSAAEVPCLPVEARLLEDASDTEQSQGLMAVFPAPRVELSPKASLIIAVDSLRDPGNLGTILRTASAAGADGALLMQGTVDALNPKALRAGMGAQFRLPTFPVEWDRIKERFEDWALVAADASAQDVTPYTSESWEQPTILIVGGEAHGLTDAGKAYAERSVSIPMASGVESLNSAVAAAVILYEIQRQRGKFTA